MTTNSKGYTAKYFLDKASQESGLNDYGAGEFLPSFEKLVYSLTEEAQLTDVGWAAMHPRLLRLLVNRLRFQADLKKHPEILDQELAPALVLVGLPRTGSTKLQRMIAASKAFQELIMWQAYNPARMVEDEEEDRKLRLLSAEEFCAWRASTNPATNAAHHVAAAQIEEETYLLEFTFESIFPMSSAYLPSYVEHLKTRDRADSYTYLRQLLQYLQWQFPADSDKPWILKSPINLGFERHILREIPGSRFLVSHRDPTTSVASLAAVMKQSRKLYSDWIDKQAVGEWALEEFSAEIQRHMDWRDSKPEAAVMDLGFADIRDNGLDVARRVHEFIDVPLSAEAEASITDWLQENVQHKHGKHVYSLEEFGLTPADVQTAFAEYMQRYAEFLRAS